MFPKCLHSSVVECVGSFPGSLLFFHLASSSSSFTFIDPKKDPSAPPLKAAIGRTPAQTVVPGVIVRVFVLIRAPLVSCHKEKRGLVPIDVLI
ncbi:unnamed protein product [Arctogadus glacialis]